MARLLLLTHHRTVNAALPGLDLLPHQVTVAAATTESLLDEGPYDAVLVDAAEDVAAARSLVGLLRSHGPLTAAGQSCPVLAVVSEAGLPAMGAGWPLADFLLARATPAEIDARIRRVRVAERVLRRGPRPYAGERAHLGR